MDQQRQVSLPYTCNIPVNADPEVLYIVSTNLDWTCQINPDYYVLVHVPYCKDINIICVASFFSTLAYKLTL